MLTEIYNKGASIKIVNNGSVLFINKLHIKTIDTVRDDTVRINTGEGPLKNIYIKYPEVKVPGGFSSAYQLRDALNDMLGSVAAGGGTAVGGATEAKQDTEISLLMEIRDLLAAIRGSGFTQPMRIDETDPVYIYRGFALANALTSEPVWAIQRLSRAVDMLHFEWADANEQFDNIWDDRYSLNYGLINASP